LILRPRHPVGKALAIGEMSDDLEFVRAKISDSGDDIEYFLILPTSPRRRLRDTATA
jgi:hypothetical protein